MQLQKWSVMITLAVVLLMAASMYYRTVAQTSADVPTDRVLGFDVLSDNDGGHFFAVLMADATGALRVDVYDSKGEQTGRIELSEPRTGPSPVRIMPE